MILLDAQAVLAVLRGEPAAPVVRRLRDESGVGALVLNLAEAVDRLVRVHAADADEALADVLDLVHDRVDLDLPVALRAGLLRAEHHHARRRAVSLADCCAAAAAQLLERIDALATADHALLALLHAEAVPYVVLPSSDGTIWTPPT